jgi:hypothetical protein
VPDTTPAATGQRKDTTGELRDDTKWLELAVNGMCRLGLLQAIRGAGGGEGTDYRVEQRLHISMHCDFQVINF